MATRRVVYDDQDSNIIHYTGEWFEETGTQGSSGNYGAPYLRTLHGTHRDARISFEFDGTGVEVFGTSILSNPTTDPDPNLECFIDGASIGREQPFEFPENNWILCGTNELSASLHKLQIDIKIKSTEQTFWLDRIEYVPSSSVPLDNKMVKLTNTDPAIRLDDSWDSFGPFKGTAKANAIAVIDFIGTSVSWVGYIPSELPHGSAFGTYAIDDGEPIQFNLVGLPENKKESEYNQIFFTTPEVENGLHTLTATFFGSGGTTPLTLDHLFIKNGTLAAGGSGSSPNNGPSTPANNPSTPANNSSMPTNNPSATVNDPSMPTNNSSTTVNNPSVTVNNPSTTVNNSSTTSTLNTATNSGSINDGGESGLNIGALLGGILGGLGFFVVIAGAFLYRRRGRLSRKNVVQPYYRLGALPTTIDHNGTPNAMAQPTYGDVALPVNQLPAKRREALRVEAQPGDRSYSRQRIVASGAGDNSGMVHSDSGIRLNQPLDEVPPHYTLE